MQAQFRLVSIWLAGEPFEQYSLFWWRYQAEFDSRLRIKSLPPNLVWSFTAGLERGGELTCLLSALETCQILKLLQISCSEGSCPKAGYTVVFLQVSYDVGRLFFGGAESVKDLRPMSDLLSGFFHHLLIGYIPVI